MGIYTPSYNNEDSVLSEDIDATQTADRPNSWWDSFRAGADAAEATTRQSYDDAAQQVLKDYIGQISKAVGKDVSSEFDKLSEGVDTSTALFGGTVSVWRSPFVTGEGGKLENRLTNFEQVVEKIKQENPEANFQFKTLSQLREEWDTAHQRQQESADKKLETSNSQHQLGFDDVGRFIGGMWGLMKDPRNIAAMVLPATNVKFGAQFGTLLAKAAGQGALYQTLLEADKLTMASPSDASTSVKSALLNISTAAAGTALLGAAGAAVQHLFKIGPKMASKLADKASDLPGMSSEDAMAGKTAAFELDQMSVVTADSPDLLKTLDAARKIAVSTEDDLITGKPFRNTQVESDISDLVKQYRAAEGTYFGRHDYSEAQLQRMRDEFGAGPFQKPDDAAFTAMTDDPVAWKAARAAEDQQIAEAIIGIKRMNGEFADTTIAPDYTETLRASRASPDLDLVTRQFAARGGDAPGIPVQESFEGALRTAANTTGDEFKGFSYTADVLGTSRKTEMGAARFMQNVDKTRTTLAELKNCILGITSEVLK